MSGDRKNHHALDRPQPSPSHRRSATRASWEHLVEAECTPDEWREQAWHQAGRPGAFAGFDIRSSVTQLDVAYSASVLACWRQRPAVRAQGKRILRARARHAQRSVPQNTQWKCTTVHCAGCAGCSPHCLSKCPLIAHTVFHCPLKVR